MLKAPPWCLTRSTGSVCVSPSCPLAAFPRDTGAGGKAGPPPPSLASPRPPHSSEDVAARWAGRLQPSCREAEQLGA